MLVLRYFKGDLFFKLLEAYIVLFGSFFFFFILIKDVLTTISPTLLSLISILLAISIFAYKKKTNKIRNLTTMITCIGAGVFIGASIGQSFGFIILYLFLGLLAIYDYLAVFVLKFMIPFAKKAAEGNYAFLIGSSDLELAPGSKKNKIKEEELSKIKDTRVKQLIKEGNIPTVSSILLGNGDIILPLTLIAGSYAIYEDIFLSVMIIVGAAAGLLFTIFLLKKYRVGLPAIPPLFTFISLALAIVFILGKPADALLSAFFVMASILSFVAMTVTLWKMNKKVQASLSPARAAA